MNNISTPIKDTKYFHYYNVNPKGRDVKDCVIRAIATFFDITWEKAAILYMKYYLRTGRLFEFSDLDNGNFVEAPNKINAEYYLDGCMDCEKVKLPRKTVVKYDSKGCKSRSTSITVKDFIDKYADINSVYFIRIYKHSSVIRENKVWDTKPCENHYLISAYKKELSA